MTLLALLACDDRVEERGAESVPVTDTGVETGDSVPVDETAETAETADSDPTPVDADGDGFTSADDCDDADPAVFPGAAERCDARDWNCDGDPYDSNVCGEPLNLDELAAGTWDGKRTGDNIASGRFLGDLDGDGIEEVGFAGGGISDATAPAAYGGLYVVAGGSALSAGRTHSDDAFAWWHANFDSIGLLVILPAGDVNGDEESDLWLLANDENCAAGLVLGPSDRWGRDQDFTVASDASWYGEGFRDGFATGGAVVDFDADGFDDAAIYSQSEGSSGEAGGGVYLIRGRAEVTDTRIRSAGDEIFVDCSRPYDISAGDLTGDGIPDLLVARGSDEHVALLDGQDLPAADGAICEVLGGTFVVPTIADHVYTQWGYTAVVVGDWTGDGIGDWVGADATRSVDYDWEGALYVVPGGLDAATLGTVDVESVAAGSLLGGAELVRLGSADPRAVADVNGDGASEVATSMGTSDALAAVILPSAAYEGLGGELPSVFLRLQDPAGAGVTSAPSIGDFDGDAILDVLVTSGPWGDSLGRSWLVRGGGIPWDDPDAW